MHRKLCEAVKRISIPYFKRANMEPINGEPACADYLPLKRGGRLEDLRDGPQGTEDDMARRRADLGFTGRRNLIVDCTTASPLAKDVKDYRAGSAADSASKRKERDYMRFFNIQQPNRTNIFFFAVETSGGLGQEARKYVRLLAKLSGGPIGWEIQNIYQMLAVEIQNARANQVYITRNRYVSSTPPLSPQGTR